MVGKRELFFALLFICNYVVSVWRGFLLVFSPGSFCQIYRVTDEALMAEAMVWPNFFLMNVFFALKGSKRFIIIPLSLDAWVGLRYSIVALPEPSM